MHGTSADRRGPVDPISLQDVDRFRMAKRARLLKARRQLSVQKRSEETKNLITKLETLVALQQSMTIAVYLPNRGEPDLRDWRAKMHAAGTAILLSDVVISPLLGIGEACFRLGNGGGYYNRTLAQFDPLPKVIGVGFSNCLIPTVFPIPWDVPMARVVLSVGSVRDRL